MKTTTTVTESITNAHKLVKAATKRLKSIFKAATEPYTFKVSKVRKDGTFYIVATCHTHRDNKIYSWHNRWAIFSPVATGVELVVFVADHPQADYVRTCEQRAIVTDADSLLTTLEAMAANLMEPID